MSRFLHWLSGAASRERKEAEVARRQAKYAEMFRERAWMLKRRNAACARYGWQSKEYNICSTEESLVAFVHYAASETAENGLIEQVYPFLTHEPTIP